ncbi:hypothetical protein JCM10207_000789 [Rhodosporidiobolus poonsookiae]
MSTPASPPAPSSSSAAMPGISLGLQRITRLLDLLGAPHTRVPVVHISGTNGKGSVSAYLSSILAASPRPPPFPSSTASTPTTTTTTTAKGETLRVGRFNSPHLVSENDAILLPPSLSPVSPALFQRTKNEITALSTSSGVNATSFEILTATAFTLFARADPPLDVAVVEVGMGGAEDATNVVPAEKTLLSIVTSVELDHQKFLGDTVGEIGRVKAGIVREGGDVVLAKQAHAEAVQAVEAVALERNARVWHAGEATVLSSPSSTSSASPVGAETALPPAPLVSLPLTPLYTSPALSAPFSLGSRTLTAALPLPGAYQLSNAAVAVLAAQLLRTLPRTRGMVPALEGVDDEAIQRGVEATRWEGRLSWVALPCPLPSPLLPLSPLAAPCAPPPRPRTRRLLLDGAHNPSSASTLSSYLSSLPSSLHPTSLIVALSAPRAPRDVLGPLLSGASGRVTRVVCTAFGAVEGMDWVRPVPTGELARGVRALLAGRGEGGGAQGEQVEVLEAPTAEDALRLLDALDAEEEGEGKERGTTLVAGSLYLVAEVIRVQRRIEAREEPREAE